MIDFSKKPLFLAPMAGFSDMAMRSVVKQFGCDVTVSEMISANALVFEARGTRNKSLTLLKKAPNEIPYIVQIAAPDKDIARQAVLILNEIEGIDGIDLNCGCPVPKVVRQGAGSALLTEPKKLCEILQTIKNTSNKKYTSVKIRLGFNDKIAPQIAPDLQSAGADFICVHGRTRAGGYTAAVDYEMIAAIKNAVKIPVIANGAIGLDNWRTALEISGADGLMIGQKSIGAPWIFAQIKAAMAGASRVGSGGAGDDALANSDAANQNELLDTLNEDFEALRRRVILAHLRAVVECYGDEVGVPIFRKHLHEYSKKMPGSAAFRVKINDMVGYDAVRRAVSEFFA